MRYTLWFSVNMLNSIEIYINSQFRYSTFKPNPRSQEPWGVWSNLCLYFVYCFIPFNLICKLISFKKKCFDLLTHPGFKVVCNNCMYVFVRFIPFNLICNMIILKKGDFWPQPYPKSPPRVSGQAFKLKFCLICFIFIILLSACKMFIKTMTAKKSSMRARHFLFFNNSRI